MKPPRFRPRAMGPYKPDTYESLKAELHADPNLRPDDPVRPKNSRAEYHRARYEARKAARLCVVCGTALAPGYMRATCESCLHRARVPR